MNIENINTWQFGTDNDKLIELVLNGNKKATTSLLNDYKEKAELPKPGDLGILRFDNEKKACVTRVTKVSILEFRNVTDELAFIEGEGDKTLAYYRKEHIKIFKKIDPSFNENSKIVFEEFEVIENLVQKRLEIANKIVNSNKDLFENNNHEIKEINAGFNNDIFSVDEKYIIKVCSNIKKENEFEVENNFYVSNKNVPYIPKLYKYDNSKSIVPFVYEILEKIEGKSLYYYWYKMDENEREVIIKELVKIVKEIHKVKLKPYDWGFKIKNNILNNFNKTKDYFNKLEQEKITAAINKIDLYLKDNTFSLIHNDLHFDNIIKNDKGLFLIDFNDSIEAPIDYEFKLLFMHKEKPWKWANIEMDPFQKKEDYKNIIEYILKHYEELNNIENLEKRMLIYYLENDIRLLTRFNNQELKDSILINVQKINEIIDNTKQLLYLK